MDIVNFKPNSISIKSIHSICDLDHATPCEFFRRFEYCIKCDNFDTCYPLTARYILSFD